MKRSLLVYAANRLTLNWYDQVLSAEAQGELERSREMMTRLRAASRWRVLAPAELKSQGGENLAVEKDGSIFVSGRVILRFQ